MTVRSLLSLVVLAMCLAVASLAAIQDMPMPKPGPEHAVLKAEEGTWDAVVEFVMMPDTPPITSKGVEVNTMGCGGLCLISDFKGEPMAGISFHGHGITAWDAAKKKYVGSWTDSMSQMIATSESTWDEKAMKYTGWRDTPDPSGKIIRQRTVVENRPDGSRTMTSFAPGPDGKEMQVMKITYTKRK